MSEYQRQPGLKRSAAIRIIMRVLRDVRVESDEQKADRILSALQGHGMLPPARDADQRSSYGYARVWTWEPEGESSERS